MPDIGSFPATEDEIASRSGWVLRRSALIGAVVAGAALATLATSAGEATQAVQAAGPELTRLLRGMAGLKLMFAGGLLAFGRTRAHFGDGALGLGALVLHGGLLASALLLWRDPAICARIDTWWQGVAQLFARMARAGRRKAACLCMLAACPTCMADHISPATGNSV